MYSNDICLLSYKTRLFTFMLSQIWHETMYQPPFRYSLAVVLLLVNVMFPSSVIVWMFTWFFFCMVCCFLFVSVYLCLFANFSSRYVSLLYLCRHKYFLSVNVTFVSARVVIIMFLLSELFVGLFLCRWQQHVCLVV